MSIQFDKKLIIDIWSCIMNTVVAKAQELSGEIIELRKEYFKRIEVSEVLCLQQSIDVCYDQLFLLICLYAG